MKKFDYSKISNVLASIDTRDYPDFSDAYIEYAEYDDREMTDEELELLNDDRDYVYDAVTSSLF